METMLNHYHSLTLLIAGQLSMQTLCWQRPATARRLRYLGQINWATVDKEKLSVSGTTSPSSRLGHIPAYKEQPAHEQEQAAIHTATV